MLTRADLAPELERSSRAAPLDDADALAVLRSVEHVIVCRGKKTTEIPRTSASLDDLRGPTGNFRAPILQVDDRLLVGFHREALEELLGL